MSAQGKPNEVPAEAVATRCLRGTGDDRRTAILKVARRAGSMSPRLYLLMVRHKPVSGQA
jgi:hypothetical protein